MGLSFSIGSLTRVSFLTLIPIFQTASKGVVFKPEHLSNHAQKPLRR
jgi:hypothetical protein